MFGIRTVTLYGAIVIVTVVAVIVAVVRKQTQKWAI